MHKKENSVYLVDSAKGRHYFPPGNLAIARKRWKISGILNTMVRGFIPMELITVVG